MAFGYGETRRDESDCLRGQPSLPVEGGEEVQEVLGVSDGQFDGRPVCLVTAGVGEEGGPAIMWLCSS